MSGASGTDRSDPIRVGDRYVEGYRRITVITVEGDEVGYSYILNGHTTVYHAIVRQPVPLSWTKVASGPEPKLMCAACRVTEAEDGQVYCEHCLVNHAAEWATLTEEEALSRTIRMLAGAADREADERGESDGDEAEAAGD